MEKKEEDKWGEGAEVGKREEDKRGSTSEEEGGR